jgi:hypothetical protein
VSFKVNVISAENKLKNITSVPPFSFYSIQILYLYIFLFEKWEVRKEGEGCREGGRGVGRGEG